MPMRCQSIGAPCLRMILENVTMNGTRRRGLQPSRTAPQGTTSCQIELELVGHRLARSTMKNHVQDHRSLPHIRGTSIQSLNSVKQLKPCNCEPARMVLRITLGSNFHHCMRDAWTAATTHASVSLPNSSHPTDAPCLLLATEVAYLQLAQNPTPFVSSTYSKKPKVATLKTADTLILICEIYANPSTN